MTISFNDNALRRTLGTDDPAQLAALKAMINDPAGEVALMPINVQSNEPVYTLCHPDEEVERLLDRYDPRRY